VSYYGYLYAKIKDKEHYQIATGYVKASMLSGMCLSGILGQLVVYMKSGDYSTLPYYSLAGTRRYDITVTSVRIGKIISEGRSKVKNKECPYFPIHIIVTIKCVGVIKKKYFEKKRSEEPCPSAKPSNSSTDCYSADRRALSFISKAANTLRHLSNSPNFTKK